MHPYPKLSCWLGAALGLASTGCSTHSPAPKAVSAEQGLAALLVKANTAETAGQKDQAINLWKQATTAYPAAKEPWAKLARLQYDAGQYVDAAQSAQQAVARDANDEEALQLLTRASLKQAARSANELARHKGITPALRTESLDTIRQLRDTMGDTITTVQPTAPVRASAAPARTEPRRTAKSSDPFSKLKDSLR